MRAFHLTPQLLPLLGGERALAHLAEHAGEIGRGDGGFGFGEMGIRRRIELCERRVEEDVAGIRGEDVGELGVSCPDDGYRVSAQGVVLVRRQPIPVAERFERLENGGPRLVRRCLDIDEKVQRLAGRGVEYAILFAGLRECRFGVLPPQRRENGLDVEGIERTGGCEGRRFMADIENAVDQPNVCFCAYTTVAQSRVEWDVAPVVVVTMEWFLWRLSAFCHPTLRPYSNPVLLLCLLGSIAGPSFSSCCTHRHDFPCEIRWIFVLFISVRVLQNVLQRV